MTWRKRQLKQDVVSRQLVAGTRRSGDRHQTPDPGSIRPQPPPLDVESTGVLVSHPLREVEAGGESSDAAAKYQLQLSLASILQMESGKRNVF